MTAEDLRKIDVEIDRNLFDGGKFVGLKKHGRWYCADARGYTNQSSKAGRYTLEEAKRHETQGPDAVTIREFPVRHYSKDSASAMLVLDKCIRRLMFSKSDIQIMGWENGDITISSNAGFCVTAKTLELAICLFALELFTK